MDTADVQPVDEMSASRILTGMTLVVGNVLTLAPLVFLFAGLGLAGGAAYLAFEADPSESGEPPLGPARVTVAGFDSLPPSARTTATVSIAVVGAWLRVALRVGGAGAAAAGAIVGSAYSGISVSSPIERRPSTRRTAIASITSSSLMSLRTRFDSSSRRRRRRAI